MKEVFAKPAVGAIIEKHIDGKDYILLQCRQKENDHHTNGLIEIVGGKIREYENIFSALKREVKEETGLEITEIMGEEETYKQQVNGVEIISMTPFCIAQNLNGIYSLITMSFICHAKGELLEATNETTDIHWEALEVVEQMVSEHPEKLFPIDVVHLKKYIQYKRKRADEMPAK